MCGGGGGLMGEGTCVLEKRTSSGDSGEGGRAVLWDECAPCVADPAGILSGARLCGGLVVVVGICEGAAEEVGTGDDASRGGVWVRCRGRSNAAGGDGWGDAGGRGGYSSVGVRVRWIAGCGEGGGCVGR